MKNKKLAIALLVVAGFVGFKAIRRYKKNQQETVVVDTKCSSCKHKHKKCCQEKKECHSCPKKKNATQK